MQQGGQRGPEHGPRDAEDAELDEPRFAPWTAVTSARACRPPAPISARGSMIASRPSWSVHRRRIRGLAWAFASARRGRFARPSRTTVASLLLIAFVVSFP